MNDVKDNMKQQKLQILDISANIITDDTFVRQLIGDMPYEIKHCNIFSEDNVDFMWHPTSPIPEDYRIGYNLVIAFHVLEYISYHKIIAALDNIIGATKIGGNIFIAVPSLEWAMDEVFANRADSRVLLSIFGQQLSERTYQKSAFTINLLRQLVNMSKKAIVMDAYHNAYQLVYGDNTYKSEQNCLLCTRLR